jgi:transporter family-2 protein
MPNQHKGKRRNVKRPLWMWAYGAFGVCFISLALAGQVVASLALDHLGLVERQMTLSRELGRGC